MTTHLFRFPTPGKSSSWSFVRDLPTPHHAYFLTSAEKKQAFPQQAAHPCTEYSYSLPLFPLELQLHANCMNSCAKLHHPNPHAQPHLNSCQRACRACSAWMNGVQETETRARHVGMECKRQTDRETPRPAYASEPSASRHRDHTRDRPIQFPEKTCSLKKTRRNPENSNHDRAGSRQTHKDSSACSAKPTKRNLGNSTHDRAGGRSSQPNSSLVCMTLKSQAWNQKLATDHPRQPGTLLSPADRAGGSQREGASLLLPTGGLKSQLLLWVTASNPLENTQEKLLPTNTFMPNPDGLNPMLQNIRREMTHHTVHDLRGQTRKHIRKWFPRRRRGRWKKFIFFLDNDAWSYFASP